MRIISGSKKGAKLKVKASSRLRPTTGRVRGALFNILGQDLTGLAVLDLFAGTGALGIEALSRGARLAVFVDSGRDAGRAIKESLAAMNLAEEGRVISKKALPALRLLAAEGMVFDLVFIDPPYQSGETQRVMETLAELPILADDAVVVAEHDPNTRLQDGYGPLALTDRRTYGRTAVSIYERKIP